MKKKIFLLYCFLGLGLLRISAQQKYFIDGTVHPVPKDLTVHLYYANHGKELKHDSCKVENGKFSFKGDIPEIELGFLIVLPDGQTLSDYLSEYKSLPSNQIGIYLENGNIKVSVNDRDLQDVYVSGTPNNVAVQEARPTIWKYKNWESKLKNQSVTAGDDSVARNKVLAEYNTMVKERSEHVCAFIKTHPSALASLDLMKRWISPSDNLDEAKKAYSFLSDDLKKTKSCQLYTDVIEKASHLNIDSIAPDFSLPDTTGAIHSLSEYKGKYVLVDFWASWCGPCRLENPNLIKAYEEFKDKNFQIVGVSLDGGMEDSRRRWITAILMDGITWPQLSDLDGWSNKAAALYLIQSIPANYLIDPTGKIIAKNIRGEDLFNTLNKYLKS